MHIEEKKDQDITLITINNNLGLEVTLCTLGASFYDIKVKDKKGNLESVILTPSNLKDFYYTTNYYGKAVGRFSGRIDNALCQINGVNYHLEKNWNNINSLHGGVEGLSFQNFNYAIKDLDDVVKVSFTYLEKETYLPGDVSYDISYEVSKKENNIRLTFKAKSTKDTLCNLTNHAYFNLSGDGKRIVTDEVLKFNCDKYTLENNNLIGISIEKVNKVFDFRKPHKIGDYINDPSLQEHIAKGYDHCFIKEDLNKEEVAVLKDLESGRCLTVSTDYPAIVCYTGNYPGEMPFGKTYYKMQKHHSICFECQYIPNGINMENVNKGILKKDEEYNHYINYKFDLLN